MNSTLAAGRRSRVLNAGAARTPRFAFTKAMQICCPIMYALARWRSRRRICGRRAEPMGIERDRLREVQGNSPNEREQMSQQNVRFHALGVEDAGRQTQQGVNVGLFE